jgi:hypothetical protein
MSTTATDPTTTAPSRAPLLAVLGFAASAVLTAVGTFWDLTNNESSDDDSIGTYLVVLGIAAVAVAVVYGLVVRTAATGNAGRRAGVLGVVGLLSVAVFWAGLPMVLVSGALACALVDKDARGSFGTGSKVAVALGAVTTALAVWLAIAG